VLDNRPWKLALRPPLISLEGQGPEAMLLSLLLVPTRLWLRAGDKRGLLAAAPGALVAARLGDGAALGLEADEGMQEVVRGLARGLLLIGLRGAALQAHTESRRWSVSRAHAHDTPCGQ
jgi:hypothetical protein